MTDFKYYDELAKKNHLTAGDWVIIAICLIPVLSIVGVSLFYGGSA